MVKRWKALVQMSIQTSIVLEKATTLTPLVRSNFVMRVSAYHLCKLLFLTKPSARICQMVTVVILSVNQSTSDLSDRLVLNLE